MTITQIPATAAFLQVNGATQSPLARYLSLHLHEVGHGSLAYDMVAPVMEGALAMAAQPFDTEERVTGRQGESHGKSTHSLLEAVLLLNNSNGNPDVLTTWPRELSGFGPHLAVKRPRGGSYGVGAEWVAAVLTAAGCNPWTQDPHVPGELSQVLHLAMLNGFGGLVDRFLDCPGAPSAQDLLDNPHLSWQELAQVECGYRVLDVVLKRGARIPTEEATIQALSFGTPRAIELLAKHGPLSLSDKARAKVEAAWKTRSSQLGSDKVETLQRAVFGEVSKAMSPAALEIGNLLSVDWGKTPNGSASQAYDFLGNMGAAKLMGRAQSKSGPMAGQWNVLAAAVASRIRQSANQGALGWSMSTMLYRQFDHDAKVWRLADCSQPPYKGSLSGALGFDWRPGIAIDGVVALGLFGQRGTNEFQQGSRSKTDDDVDVDVAAFAAATALKDVTKWAAEHGPDAAAFSCLVLKSPKVNAAKCLLHTWETALRRVPDMAAGIPAEKKIELLCGLVAQFIVSTSWSGFHAHEQNAFDRVASVLFPHLSQKSFLEESNLDPVSRRAALVWHMARLESRSNLDTHLETMQAQGQRLDDGDIALVKTWVDSHHLLSDAERQSVNATMQRWELQQNTAPAAQSRRGPRL